MRQKFSYGFTLIEMIFVMALFSFMMLALTQFFLGSSRIYSSQNAELDVNMSARSALDDIDAYVRQATQVTDSYTIYATGATTLILQVQSINGANQLISGSYDHVVIYLVGSTLYREIFPDAGSSRQDGARVIGSNISTLNFTYDNASLPLVTTVTTDLTVTKDLNRDVQEIIISSKSRLRN
ncbi:MAG: prepilin-type N-terminal cleavage/methylation domain-containing protein [Candidatus Doudnabacteria bacterium]|nr:prepilin-type N-terminal cleavage/methylation domain-containing protein [Candidatus Doudnabacteria bacterium]